MAAIDKLMLAAKRPDCLLALFSHNGGTVLSHMRGSVMPSSTPRNFATEPATYAASWHDFQAIVATKKPIDFEFLIEFIKLDNTINRSIFYHSLNSNESFYVLSGMNSNQLNCSFRSFFDQAYLAGNNQRFDSFVEDKIFSIVFRRLGMVANCYVNGNLLYSITGTSILPITFSNSPWSAFNGLILHSYLKDIDIEETLWQYPTWSEKVRLITKTNVRTDRFIFEAANPALSWSIKTPLVANMAGTVISIKNDTISINGTEWNRMTGVMSGLAQDKITALLVFDRILSAHEISSIT
jgi:hypothetical protein